MGEQQWRFPYEQSDFISPWRFPSKCVTAAAVGPPVTIADCDDTSEQRLAYDKEKKAIYLSGKTTVSNTVNATTMCAGYLGPCDEATPCCSSLVCCRGTDPDHPIDGFCLPADAASVSGCTRSGSRRLNVSAVH